jgi:hypothetical protein
MNTSTTSNLEFFKLLITMINCNQTKQQQQQKTDQKNANCISCRFCICGIT